MTINLVPLITHSVSRRRYRQHGCASGIKNPRQICCSKAHAGRVGLMGFNCFRPADRLSDLLTLYHLDTFLRVVSSLCV